MKPERLSLDSIPLLVHPSNSLFYNYGASMLLLLFRRRAKSDWVLHLIGNKVPLATHDSSEVAHTLNRRFTLTPETAGTVDVCAVSYPCQ